jgi:hypothetical protein
MSNKFAVERNPANPEQGFAVLLMILLLHQFMFFRYFTNNALKLD